MTNYLTNTYSSTLLSLHCTTPEYEPLLAQGLDIEQFLNPTYTVPNEECNKFDFQTALLENSMFLENGKPMGHEEINNEISASTEEEVRSNQSEKPRCSEESFF